MADIGKILGSASPDTFLGMPKIELADLKDRDTDVAVIGFPCATPYAATGTYAAGAPAALRSAIAPYAQGTPHMDFDLGGPVLGDGTTRFADCGDIAWSETDHSANRETVTAATRTIIEAGAVPVVLGGDDSIPIPMYEGLAGTGPCTILQIDAHIDWRDEVDGEQLGLSSNMRRASEMPHIEKIIQVGARGVGSARPSDYEDAKAWGVEFITARELRADGPAAVFDHIPEGARLLINFDVDALDPAIMPAVIGPSPGGLDY